MVRKLIVVALVGALVLAVRLALPPRLAVVDGRNFAVHVPPFALPRITFEDGERRPRTLEDFRGRVVLLNVWATWCPPCRKEMQALDRLRAARGGDDFEVVALSVDHGGVDAVKRLYADIGVQNLAIAVDPSAESGNALGVIGLPTTLLVDREGREAGRFVGAAEWDAPATIAFLNSLVGRTQELR
jgi:thiol-disulfide isomerase/thioredoxin